MNKQFIEEIKIQAAKQVIEQGHTVASVSEHLGVSTNSLYNWIKKYGSDSKHYQQTSGQEARIR
ncbi:transposase [uncultured Shewanella sp.]|uniref:transposase n=1 Tax=Shewanella atlantica TaxID=271099 RepID=UPI00260FD79D|nr:transposase [uncultured Shewanella sp.]